MRNALAWLWQRFVECRVVGFPFSSCHLRKPVLCCRAFACGDWLLVAADRRLFCLLCSCFAVFLLVALCLAVAVPGGGGEQNAFGAFPKLHHGFVWVGQRLDLHAVHGEECGDDEVVQAFWIPVFFR